MADVLPRARNPSVLSRRVGRRRQGRRLTWRINPMHGEKRVSATLQGRWREVFLCASNELGLERHVPPRSTPPGLVAIEDDDLPTWTPAALRPDLGRVLQDPLDHIRIVSSIRLCASRGSLEVGRAVDSSEEPPRVQSETCPRPWSRSSSRQPPDPRCGTWRSRPSSFRGTKEHIAPTSL